MAMRFPWTQPPEKTPTRLATVNTRRSVSLPNYNGQTLVGMEALIAKARAEGAPDNAQIGPFCDSIYWDEDS